MSSDAVPYFPDATVPNPTETALPQREAVERSAQAVIPISEISDEQLLKRVGTGDREALSNLFRRHAGLVFSVACRILRDESEAEDLVQELFLFLFQKASIFDETKSSGVSWIIQMAYHRAIDRRRYLDVRHHYTAQEFREELQLMPGGQLAIDEVAGRALLHRLRAELSAEQLRTLEMHLFEGYSLREIADRTGQTFGNVRNHYYRGLERLRSHVFPRK
jgi:RNA polymerase sigma-70 factor (ECF subfamily)